MFLNYNQEFSEKVKGYQMDNSGFFINPKMAFNLDIIDVFDERHNKAALLQVIDWWFNPSVYHAPKSKEQAIMYLENYLNIYKSKGHANLTEYNFYNYLAYKLFDYFLTAYKSPNTTMWENKKDIVDLRKTTGFNPKYDYSKYSIYASIDNYKRRSISEVDRLNILKSILIQYADIDSLESAREKTIYTSKFNTNEYFYNYLLMDFNIVTLPKMIFDEEKQVYVNYEKNEFLISDREQRYQDEIASIKKCYKLEDRKQFFRK